MSFETDKLRELRKVVGHTTNLSPESKSAISAVIDRLINFDNHLNAIEANHDDEDLQNMEVDFHEALLNAIVSVNVKTHNSK